MDNVERGDDADTAQIRPTFADLGIPRNPQLADAPLGLGRRREWSDLQKKEFIFAGVTAVSLLVVLILTIYKLATIKKSSPDFAFAIVLIICTVACATYLVEGILQERPYEILALVITVISIWIYVVLNYILGVQGPVKLARLILCSVVCPVMIVLGFLITKQYIESGRLVFRTVGANTLMQDMCKVMFAFYGLLKFDLQLSLCMVVFILTNGAKIDTEDIVVICVGLFIVICSGVIGFLSVKNENKVFAIIFSCTLVLQPAYVLFKTIKSAEHFDNRTDGLAVPTFVCAALALVFRAVMTVYFIRCWLNFGKGLKEKVYGKTDSTDQQQNNRRQQDQQNAGRIQND